MATKTHSSINAQNTLLPSSYELVLPVFFSRFFSTCLSSSPSIPPMIESNHYVFNPLQTLAMSPSAVGSKSDCESRGRWFEPRSGHILSLTFGHEKQFYDRFHTSADSRRAVVSYWRKNRH